MCFVLDSPLTMISTPNSTVLCDLTRIHSDMLQGMRIGFLAYERMLALVVKWSPKKSDDGENGEWYDLEYR